MSALFFLLISIISNVYSLALHTPWTISASSTYNSYQFNVLHHLTAIAPYFESNAEGLSPDPPQGCKVDKAIYQVRHGSIYANEYDYVHTIEPFLQRLKDSAGKVDFSRSEDLSFLTHWTSPIFNSEEQVAEVTKLGFLEAFSLGTRLAYRYPDLLPTKKVSPFKVWASDSNRTRHSAEALFAGLYGGHEKIGRVVSISEDQNQGANTLTPTKSCPKFDVTTGTQQAEVWLKYYTAPIIARLNAKISGFRFVTDDVLAMQELCGYESIIRGTSSFCGIFTPEDWLSFEYYFDIKYYYELGYGNDLSPSLGLPWIIATSDLLSDKNSKAQDLYISVAHRQLPPLILTALGLYNDSQTFSAPNKSPILPLDRINYQRQWKSSNFISFLGQIALERLDCKSPAYNGSFVRVLVNATPKPLPTCMDGPGGSCTLEKYKNYVKNQQNLYEDFLKVCSTKKDNIADALKFFLEE